MLELNCPVCSKHIYRKPSEVARSKNKVCFCSRRCFGLFYTTNKRKKSEGVRCEVCGDIHGLKSFPPHCTYQEHSYRLAIREWREGKRSGHKGNSQRTLCLWLRRYIFEKYRSSCAICGWDKLNQFSNLPTVHIHHIDGNRENNAESNLILLCPNCHSLTENWGKHHKEIGPG